MGDYLPYRVLILSRYSCVGITVSLLRLVLLSTDADAVVVTTERVAHLVVTGHLKRMFVVHGLVKVYALDNDSSFSFRIFMLFRDFRYVVRRVFRLQMTFLVQKASMKGLVDLLIWIIT